jgi:hypothetical protein
LSDRPTLALWPLVVVIEDCHIPEYAAEIVKLTAETPDEMSYAMIHALAVYAEVKLRGAALN